MTIAITTFYYRLIQFIYLTAYQLHIVILSEKVLNQNGKDMKSKIRFDLFLVSSVLFTRYFIDALNYIKSRISPQFASNNLHYTIHVDTL